MNYRFRMANGLSAAIHWLADKRMENVAKACHRQLIIGPKAYAAIEINFEKETVYLVGVCSVQTRQGAVEVAEFWSKDPEAVDHAGLLVCNGTCYRLDMSEKGRTLLAGIKRRVPPSVSILVEESADNGRKTR